MVNLTRIYTRTGDDGTTGLSDFGRTSKNDPRLVAYAEVDEANSAIGVALASGALTEDMARTLTRIQNDLFDVGADLSTPVREDPEHPPLRVLDAWVEAVEADCDRYNADLSTLRSFVLPGGTPAAAALHLARAITRRAERAAWAALEAHGDTPAGKDAARGVGGVNPLTARYLNRLSDLLFVLARAANHDPATGAPGDVLWLPGGER